MCFAMLNWCRQKALYAVIFGSIFSQQSFSIALENSNKFALNNSLSNSQTLSIDRWIARTSFECEAVDPDYREVYSFETENYYINICQLDDRFYYRRQSKYEEGNTLLVPAEVVFRGSVFQAFDDDTTYFVGKNGDRHYSSVMHNNNEIVFEPERDSPSATSSQDLAEANLSLPQDAKAVNRPHNASVELDNPDHNSQSEQDRVCMGEESTFHPRLEDWQNLLGQSPDKANTYAVNNGHQFTYDEQTPNQALITTKEGSVVNLNIAATDETIEQICIEQIAEN